MRNLFLAAALLVVAPPALACSMAGEYRPPTNFELVQRADLVVLGRVESEIAAQPADWNKPNVRLLPIRAIKGELPVAPLGLIGTINNRGEPVPPHPTALNEVHPSTLWGGCIRQVYAKGTLVVATFVKTSDGSYSQIWSPFARAVEDVESEDGLWVRAATLYAGLADTPAERLPAVLEGEAKRLEATGDPGAAAIAADLRVQLIVIERYTPMKW
ncbi:hypothetical protein P1X14_03775 [Sphingomonas sp. AOB5]|uniref:hypothetical protein n=1 Tax=Sphingomonas sp. AOB5 TaxID=3034017 RepID=UPI0023F701F2|nr:hypothetical protein [Sphingomonas sp. AOB5]MDF7774354.1 hypothetical protein [Sphingomonas sp. AOB5]